MKTSNETHPEARRGVILVGLIVALLIVTMYLASLTQMLVSARRQGSHNALRRQAVWLAESALERGVAQLRTSPDYEGETWRPSLQLSESSRGATIQIEVMPAANRTDQRVVSVRADYPVSAVHRQRYSKQITVNLTRERAEP